MITYSVVSSVGLVEVCLEGKLVGRIKQWKDGWQYIPLGQKRGGEIFPTLEACKKSLEEE